MAIPNVEIKYSKIFINNEWIDALSGKTVATFNPCTGKICDVAEGEKADVDDAVKAAMKAFKLNSPWRMMDASARGQLLNKLADLIERDRKYLSELETFDSEKPTAIANAVDLKFSIDIYRYYASWADRSEGKTITVDGDFLYYTRHEPIDVNGQIIPWNFPLVMQTVKLAPALAAGNTIVIKPAEQTPLTALYVAQLVKEAGFPPGVVNIIPGYDQTKNINNVCFSWTIQVGKLIQPNTSLSTLNEVTLKLGGKSPHVVFDDCDDLNAAVEICHSSLFFNECQCCTAGSRVFVQDTIYDKFVELSVERTLKTTIGSPWDVTTEQTPKIDQEIIDNILELFESWKKDGAKMLSDHSRYGDKGCFFQSTVFSNVMDEMKIAKEEIFGPVMQILKFSTTEELIERVNNTMYGTADGVHTSNIERTFQYVHGVHAGILRVNSQTVTVKIP